MLMGNPGWVGSESRVAVDFHCVIMTLCIAPLSVRLEGSWVDPTAAAPAPPAPRGPHRRCRRGGAGCPPGTGGRRGGGGGAARLRRGSVGHVAGGWPAWGDGPAAGRGGGAAGWAAVRGYVAGGPAAYIGSFLAGATGAADDCDRCCNGGRSGWALLNGNSATNDNRETATVAIDYVRDNSGTGGPAGDVDRGSATANHIRGRGGEPSRCGSSRLCGRGRGWARFRRHGGDSSR